MQKKKKKEEEKEVSLSRGNVMNALI